MELAECTLGNIDFNTIGNDQFIERLRKRVLLLSNITINSKSDDELSSDPELDAIYNYNSEQEFLDEEENGVSVQDAWDNTW